MVGLSDAADSRRPRTLVRPWKNAFSAWESFCPRCVAADTRAGVNGLTSISALCLASVCFAGRRHARGREGEAAVQLKRPPASPVRALVSSPPAPERKRLHGERQSLLREARRKKDSAKSRRQVGLLGQPWPLFALANSGAYLCSPSAAGWYGLRPFVPLSSLEERAHI